MRFFANQRSRNQMRADIAAMFEQQLQKRGEIVNATRETATKPRRSNIYNPLTLGFWLVPTLSRLTCLVDVVALLLAFQGRYWAAGAELLIGYFVVGLLLARWRRKS